MVDVLGGETQAKIDEVGRKVVTHFRCMMDAYPHVDAGAEQSK
jgi:hypothetical protein